MQYTVQASIESNYSSRDVFMTKKIYTINMKIKLVGSREKIATLSVSNEKI